MNDFGILAASYVGPEGSANRCSGLHPWPADLREALQAGDLTDLHWSLLFDSDPARFARMDLMCRLGLMAAELLEVRLEDWPAERRDRVGVWLETSAGCLATDVRFLQTPRASLFTYTLPSTLIGEICIRYRLRGPAACCHTALPGAPGALREAVCWLEANEAETVLCLSCEAVDRQTIARLPPELRPPAGWHAAVLLLGKSGACLNTAEPLLAACRRVCRIPEHTC